MNAKKLAGFLLCSSAFTHRNITSVLLVAVFFATYVFAGGKIDTKLPDFQVGGGLGRGKLNGNIDGSQDAEIQKKRSPEDVLGLRDTKVESETESLNHKRGNFFTEEDREQAENEGIDKDGLIKGSSFASRRDQRLLKKLDTKPRDTLDVIEERLKSK